MEFNKFLTLYEKKIKTSKRFKQLIATFHTDLYKCRLYCLHSEAKINVIRLKVGTSINLLNPTGHVMHQQFNIQQPYVLPTL